MTTTTIDLNRGLEQWVFRTWNRIFESENGEVRQPPAPSESSDDIEVEEAVKRARIVYKFKGSDSVTRVIEVRSLTCPFCDDEEGYDYFDGLMLHYKTRHQHFEFVPVCEAEQSGAYTFKATILISLNLDGKDN